MDAGTVTFLYGVVFGVAMLTLISLCVVYCDRAALRKQVDHWKTLSKRQCREMCEIMDILHDSNTPLATLQKINEIIRKENELWLAKRERGDG